MAMIHRIDDKSWELHGPRADDVILQLSRMAFQQFPWQSTPTNGLLARYHMLYSHPLVAPMIEAEFGMTAEELFQLVLLLAEEMTRRPTLAFEFLPGAEESIRGPVLALASRISRSCDKLRAEMLERRSFDVNWAYGFNPLRAYPLVHAGNPVSLMCPMPPILLQRLTDGLYFDLMRADRGFGNAVGKAFECYVGAVAGRIGRNAFELLGEVCWGKPQRRSVDWVIGDRTAVIFVECKLGRLDVASQTEIADEPPLLAAIKRLAGNVGQLYATLSEALEGGYPHWKSDGRPVYPIVVLFHEWFCFGPFFYRHLDALVKAELRRRGLDATLSQRHPYSVCSIAEFEGLLTACAETGIDGALSEKLSPAHRQSLLRGFLAGHHPSALNNASGTFEDGMDSVMEAPSRFTGNHRV